MLAATAVFGVDAIATNRRQARWVVALCLLLVAEAVRELVRAFGLH